MNEKRTTASLESVLKNTSPDNISDFLTNQKQYLADQDKPFATYMRQLFRERHIRQQDVFLSADIPEGYGYKIISEEKHTRQRDLIIRICLAAHFSTKDTQRALKLYGMSELYAKVPRDSVLIIAFNRGIYEISAVDDLLLRYDMEPLYSCHSDE